MIPLTDKEKEYYEKQENATMSKKVLQKPKRRKDLQIILKT